MEPTAVELVKVVVRSFYEDKHAVFIDFLLRERMLPDDLVADRMQCLIKDVNKIAAKLREDRLIKTISRQETREYDGRLFHRTYYYIDFGIFADVVKYRLYLMRKTLEERIKNDLNERGYVCENCKKTFGALDVNTLFNHQTLLFHCDTCGVEVVASEASSLAGQRGNIQSKLIEQTNSILRLLKKLDSVQLPPFDPLEYLRHQEAFELVSPGTSSSIDDLSRGMEGEGRELRIAGADSAQKGVMAPEVEIVSSTKAAPTYGMPVWHTHSTVTGTKVAQAPPSHDALQSARTDTSAAPQIDVEKYYEQALSRTSMSAPHPRDGAAEGSSKRAKADGEDTSEVPLVTVGGVVKRLCQITEDDKDAMTEEEYSAYYEAFISHGQA